MKIITIDRTDETILKYILQHPQCGYRDLKQVIRLSTESLKARLEKLAALGHIEPCNGRQNVMVIQGGVFIDSNGKIWRERRELDYVHER